MFTTSNDSSDVIDANEDFYAAVENSDDDDDDFSSSSSGYYARLSEEEEDNYGADLDKQRRNNVFLYSDDDDLTEVLIDNDAEEEEDDESSSSANHTEVEVELEVETKLIKEESKTKKRWRPGNARTGRFLSKENRKYCRIGQNGGGSGDPFGGRNGCGFRNVPANKRKLDDYVLRDLGGFDQNSFGNRHWKLFQLVFILFVVVVCTEPVLETEPYRHFPLKMLGLAVVWFLGGFLVTYHAGLMMVWQDWYVKNNPDKFVPKDPAKAEAKAARQQRYRRLEEHAVQHKKADLQQRAYIEKKVAESKAKEKLFL